MVWIENKNPGKVLFTRKTYQLAWKWEKQNDCVRRNYLGAFRWKNFRKNLAAYEKQKRKIAESYPLLSEITPSKEEWWRRFFYLFPAPAGSDAPAEGFSFRFREASFSLLAGILQAFISRAQANILWKENERG